MKDQLCLYVPTTIFDSHSGTTFGNLCALKKGKDQVDQRVDQNIKLTHWYLLLCYPEVRQMRQMQGSPLVPQHHDRVSIVCKRSVRYWVLPIEDAS